MSASDTTEFPERTAILSGIGISKIGRRLGVPGIELTLEAAHAAISDAGLTLENIDGLASLGDVSVSDVSAGLGLNPAAIESGPSTGGLLSPILDACRTIASGRARHILVYRTVLMMGGSILPSPDTTSPSVTETSPDSDAAAVMGDLPSLLAYHAYSAANWVSMHCQRHMHLYGTTKEQFGWLAIASRRHAAHNPLAIYREPITMDSYLGARPVSTPFGLLDCDVPIDGSIAIVVSTDAHASGCPHRPIRIAAVGRSANRDGWIGRPDYPRMAAADAAADLWSHTDIRPSDVDAAELYDGFTFLALSWLEALGLCGEGESGPFVDGGTRIALNGSLPLNTYGGQLSAGRMHGYWLLHEACSQLRGTAAARQVTPQPEVVVVSTGGGPIADCMLLTC